VHIGLAQLLAWRLSRTQPNTFSLSVNDLGLEIVGALPVDSTPTARPSCSARTICWPTCWPA
jgi:ATP-dependent Lhr-like helicase